MTIKDSGKREEFTTGSRRDTREGKGRYDLLSPISLKRLAVHMENGIKKYGERNWEKGQPLMRYLDSALRHIQVYIEGNREEDHMAAAMWNIHGFIHTQTMIERGELPKELDDVPSGYLPTPKEPEKSPLKWGVHVLKLDNDLWTLDSSTREYWWRSESSDAGEWVRYRHDNRHLGVFATMEDAMEELRNCTVAPPDYSGESF